jgi:hypothetical protein
VPGASRTARPAGGRPAVVPADAGTQVVVDANAKPFPSSSSWRLRRPRGWHTASGDGIELSLRSSA